MVLYDAAPTTKSPALTVIPLRAVISPTESILVTSSYVNVPPIETVPLKVAFVPDIGPPKVAVEPPVLMLESSTPVL